MSSFTRTFNDARLGQGFRDQAHLSAFFAYFDHTEGSSCPDCKPSARWSEGDASWQPTTALCAKAQQLFADAR